MKMMRRPVKWFWPLDLTIMPIRSEQCFQALGRVVFGMKRRRTTPQSLRDTVVEENLLKGMSVRIRFFQSLPNRLRFAED